MLYLFQIDFTIYAYHVFIKSTTIYNKRYITHYKVQSAVDTFGSENIYTLGKK